MKITNKLKAEILNVYNAYWDNYLEGDVEAMTLLLADEYTQVGSADTEVFYTKKDAVNFLYETIDQVAGKLEMRNRSTRLEQQDNLILIHELCDLYVLADDKWVFYAKARASTLMQKKKEGWKIIHQHSSFPDARTSDGENIAIDKIAEENRELREAVKRRTVELEQKNRDLEIEASLERVRAVAMSMNKSEDLLSICEVSFKKFKKLGFDNIRNALIHIQYDEQKYFMDYDFSDLTGGAITKIEYGSHPIVEDYLKQIRSAKDAFYQGVIKEDQLEEWKDFRKNSGQIDDPRLDNATALYYYFFSIGIGDIGISTLQPIDESQLIILKRFRNVFDLAYRRFIDIQKAEVQAREAQIELGLERVRARAMAMQKSEELSELVDTVFKELTKLDFALNWCIINIINEPSLSNTVWAANPDIDKAPESYHMKFEDYPFHHAMMKGYQERRIKHVYVLEGQEKKIYDEYLFNETEFRRVPAAAQTASRAMEKYVVTFTFSNFGGLQTVGETPLSDANLDILSRFGKVFDLTYTRFNDLKLAEAQAREAQIEAALEKVRAVAMSMNKPDDLLNVCEVLFTEFHKLGFDEIRNAMINIHNDEKGTFINYDYSDEIGKSINHLTYNIHPVIEKQIKQIRSANDAFSETSFTDKDLEEWKKFRKKIGEKDDSRINEISALYYYFYSIGTGSIGISTFNSINEEKLELLKRFRNVFSLSYQRYSDIALAEAQAKESQIQLALERVRARTMAMHHSDELAETAYVLFQQFKKIDKEPKMITIGILNAKENVIEFWVTDWSGGGSKINQKFHGSTDEPTILNKIYKAWENGSRSIVVELAGENLQKWVDYRVKISGIPDDKDYSNEKGFVVAAFFSNGILSFSIYEPVSPETIQLLERFAGVFDITYTRFLDLQKAEAQAREAEIELALERVRARTMAMQKSDELKEVIKIVYQQLTHLKIKLDHAGFVVDYTPKSDWHFWIADERDIPSKITHPYFESVWANQFNEAKEKGADFFATKLTFEEKNKFYNELLSYVPGLPEASKEFYLSCPGLAATTVLMDNVGLYIENFSGIPYSEEENATLMRFGKVFQQTYTRFLDLQKAEAQARESQIEAALEKVRSKAMAMHSSEDLSETIVAFYHELEFLHITPRRCGVGIVNKETRDVELSSMNSTEQGKSLEIIGRIKLAGHPVLSGVWENWLLQKEYRPVLRGEEINEYYNFLSPQVKYPDYSHDVVQYGYYFFFQEGGTYVWTEEELSEEVLKIYRRFTSVLSLTYKRYKELKEAEAQAKEAQIELALERVRARTMAMQNSNELVDTSIVLFHQLKNLGVDSIRTGVATMDAVNETVEVWSTSGMSGNFEKKILGVVPTNVHPMFTGIFNSWKNKEPFFAYELKGDELKKYYKTLSSYLSYPEQKEFNEREMIYTFFFSEGSLNVVSHNILKEEECNLTIRFAKVFGLVYTRFLDLQKAEAQAREAKIEAALERVRAKAMAMHTSNDLSETMGVLFTELPKLGISSLRCGVVVLSKSSRQAVFYGATNSSESDALALIGSVEMSGHPVFEMQYECWLKNENYFTTLGNDELRSYYKILFSRLSTPYTPREIGDEKEFGYYFAFSEGLFYAWTDKPYSENEIAILNRFKAIFDLTFRRYLDLQKAEAQAREAKIEAALERIRSRTMAMQHSEELQEAALLLFQQVKDLGVETGSCGFNIWEENTKITKSWMSSPQGGFQPPFKLSHSESPIYKDIYSAMENGEEFFVRESSGEELKNHFKYLTTVPVIGDVIKKYFETGYQFPEKIFYHIAFFKQGYLTFHLYESSSEAGDIFKRFANVFEQTYTRFLDLQKAELQAREAKIEASLERVRSKAMAMHSPNDLSETVNVFFKELKTLGIIPIRCGVGHIDDETRTTSLTSTTSSQQGESFQVIGKIKQTGHPVLDGIFDYWKLQKEYHPVLEGEDIKAFYDVMNAQIGYPEYPEGVTQYGNSFPFKEGFVFAWTENKLSEEELQIFRRFTSVLSLTYRRYMDLKEAEAQAREAKIEASLEKVRSKTMAMQSSDELADTAAVVFQQLINLGIEPNRIYITIIKDETGICEFWITDEDGTKVSSAFKANLNENQSFKKMYEGWKQNKKSITIDMYGEELRKYFHHLSKLNVPFKDGLSQTRRMQYIAYFSKGFIGVASPDETKPETIQLLERFAAVFNLTYTRFNDLQQAEAQNKIIQADNDRKTKELEEARELQISLLPKELPKLPGMEIAAFMRTATEVGGDYYDFIVQKNGVLSVALGDATGHGLQAGTMVTLMKGLFTSNSSQLRPKEFMSHCAQVIKDIKLGRILMSFSYLRFENSQLLASSAGMPPIYYHHKNSNRTEEIIIQGMPLGAMRNLSYNLVEKKLCSGDTILLLTDGLPEQMDNHKVPFDYSRVRKYFEEIAENTPDDIIRSLIKKADDWMDGTSQADDITFVVIKVK